MSTQLAKYFFKIYNLYQERTNKMTKKILYWLDRNFIIFATANKIQEKVDVEKYAIIDDVEDQKEFYTNQSLINFKKMWHFTDFVQVKSCLLYTSPSPRD